MPRKSRIYSVTDVYHIIIRGIDKQDIFYNDRDREFMLKQLLEIKKKFKLQIYAYCLMYNHIHLIIRVKKDLLSKSIQSLEVRYSQYFNKKYERTGAFFEERFKSKNVQDKKYLLDVCRYVHRNPENSGIATVETYKWSSYKEYIDDNKIVDKKVLLHYFDNNINNFIDFTVNQKRDLYEQTRESLEHEFMNRLTDEDVSKIIIKILKLRYITDITKLRDDDLDDAIQEICKIPGTNMTQLARVTRINRYYIAKRCKDNNYKKE